MASPEILILDVGHGNCAVLRDTSGTTVIDCAPGATLKQTLKQLGITSVSLVLISHADEDHVGGLIGLLADPDISIDEVYLNGDALKRTEIWTDVRIALADARKTKQVQVHSTLTSTLTGSLDRGDVHIEVVAPSPELVLGGAGSTDTRGRRLTSNSISAVVRLLHNGRSIALFTGDLDGVGLDNILSDGRDLHSHILIYPHHGGKAGGTDTRAFAEALCSSVRPGVIIFSVARSREGFPRLEVVDSVKEFAPDAHIACTQLSKQCAKDTPVDFPHLANYPARGRDTNNCCAGTIHLELSGEPQDFVTQHAQFVRDLRPTMCRK